MRKSVEIKEDEIEEVIENGRRLRGDIQKVKYVIQQASISKYATPEGKIGIGLATINHNCPAPMRVKQEKLIKICKETIDDLKAELAENNKIINKMYVSTIGKKPKKKK
jgi:hypothetical protein